MEKILVIPCEIYPRDVLSRLLLACKAAESGFTVIYGNSGKCCAYAATLSHGIYLDKCLASSHSTLHRILSQKGLLIGSMDEEGLSSENNQLIYKDFRFSRESSRYASFVICWGHNEAKVATLKAKQDCLSLSVESIGNPRLDIARAKSNSTRNDYILLLSNISNIHANGIGFSYSQMKAYKNELSYDDKKNEYRWLTLFKLADFYLRIAQARPSKKIVLRPHPSEDHRFWVDLFRGYKNVSVEYNHNYEQTLANAEIIIHSSCTSGVFASLSRQRCLSFIPYKNDPYSHFVANRVSTMQAESVEDGLINLNLLEKMTDSEVAYENHKKLEENNQYLEISNASCSEVIVTFLTKIASEYYANRNVKNTVPDTHKLNFLKRLKRRISSNPDPPNESFFPQDQYLAYTNTYNSQTWQRLGLNEIRSHLQYLDRLKLISINKVRVSQISEELFAVLPPHLI